MSGTFKVVIPARYASSRLPGKPLADICGQPMILHVVSRALGSGAGEVVVATDDERIADTVTGAGYEAALTRADHASGSDRVMEVAVQRGWAEDVRIVNVQGDEPLIPPTVIAQVAGLLEPPGAVEVATLCEPLLSRSALFDPNVVKVVRSQQGLALYFSRAPVPYARDEFAVERNAASADAALPRPGLWFRHIGIYGYTLRSLARFVALPKSALESTEALEQLRMLDSGMAIRVAEAVAQVPGGVDTPKDLTRVREIFDASGDSVGIYRPTRLLAGFYGRVRGRQAAAAPARGSRLAVRDCQPLRTHESGPRLVAWFGDPDLNYRYSGSDHRCTGWHPLLKELQRDIRRRCGFETNFLLLNRYQDGQDSMGWHTDDERGHGPLVASLSLGGTRRFLTRPVAGEPAVKWDLEHGSLLMLNGREPHALPKTRRRVAERINLSFRFLNRR